MKGSAGACLMTLGAAVASSCAADPSGSGIDLLARRPDGAEGAAGVHVDLKQRRVHLDPGAEVRYRIEPRAPGHMRLTARANGEGTFEEDWVELDLAKGTETPAGSLASRAPGEARSNTSPRFPPGRA